MQRPDIAASMASHLDRLVTVFLESISAFQPGNYKLSIEVDFCMYMHFLVMVIRHALCKFRDQAEYSSKLQLLVV